MGGLHNKTKSVLIEELKRLHFYTHKGEPIENLSIDELKQLVATARLKEESYGMNNH